MKMYPQLSREYIRDGISYVNLAMLQNVIPPFRTDDKNKKKKGKQPNIPEKEMKEIVHIDQLLLH